MLFDPRQRLFNLKGWYWRLFKIRLIDVPFFVSPAGVPSDLLDGLEWDCSGAGWRPC